MARYEKVEISQIENGFIVEHINTKGDNWADRIETYIDTIENVGVYLKVFYTDLKKKEK